MDIKMINTTKKEKEALRYLNSGIVKEVYWCDTNPIDSATFNRLVKKGLAHCHNKGKSDQYWKISVWGQQYLEVL